MSVRKKLILVLFILGVSMLILPSNVVAFDDIDYEFQRDVLFNESNPELNLFNMRNQSVYNGTYPATYTFTGENGLTSDDINFVDIDDSQTSGLVEVSESYLGHKEVLNLTQVGSHNADIINFLLSGQITGIIEFWWNLPNSTDDKNSHFFLVKKIGTVNAIRLRITNNEIQAFYSGSYQFITSYIDNSWIHVRIDFDCGTDTFDLFINGTEFSNIDFDNVVNQIDRVRLVVSENQDYSAYYDAINYDFFGVPSKAYDFSDDTISTEPEGWISANTGSATSTIIAGPIDSRSNILQLHNLVGNAFINTSFDFSDNQNFQFDFAKDNYDNNSRGTIVFREGDSNVAILVFSFVHLFNANLSGETLIYDAFVNINTFYTIFIIFDSISNRFDVYIDGILRKAELPYITDVDSIDSVQFFTEELHTEYKNYYDNIFMNLELIDVGENLQPILEVLEGFEGLLETDKYEFAFETVNGIAPEGQTSFGSWVFDTENNGLARIALGKEPDIDRVVELIVNVEGLASITRTNIDSTDSLIDVNIGFNFTSVLSTRGNFTVLLKSSDQSTITGFRVELASNELSYFDGSWNNILNNNMDVSTLYNINLFLNYDIDIVKLEFIVGVEHTFITNYVFDMVSTGKTGLYEIDIEQFSDSDNSVCEVDYVGIYVNGGRGSGELGIITVPINEAWHFERHYLHTVRFTGKIHEGVVEGNYVGGETPFQNVRNDTALTPFRVGDLEKINVYDFYWKNMTDANLVFTVLGSNISISDITIEGSKLVEGSNEHFLIFSSGGLDSKDNYFYVQSNELRFIHNTSIDDVNEFIQASFNIVDKTSVDTAISYMTNIDFNAVGFFRINFTDDTSQVIQMENTLKTTRVLLTTDKTIGDFVILISDNNNNLKEGLTTGLVKDISLLDIETSLISVVTLNLVDMIIPLIMILIPTLLISAVYGKFLIIPLFILFSLLCAITSIIPIWLFFVIGLSTSLFIFFGKESEGF